MKNKLYIIFIAVFVSLLTIASANLNNDNTEQIESASALEINGFTNITISSNDSEKVSASKNGLIQIFFNLEVNDGNETCSVSVRDTNELAIPSFTGTGSLANDYINGRYEYSFKPELADHAEGVVEYQITCDTVSTSWRSVGTDDADLTIDNTAPEVSQVNVITNNESFIAKNGDEIILEMFFSEMLGNVPTVEIGGFNAEVTIDESNQLKYYAKIIIDESTNTYTEGVILDYIINDVVDPANNEMQMIDYNGETGVKIDLTAPQILSVNLSIQDSTATVAKVGDTLLLEFTTSESISPTFDVTIAGKRVTAIVDPTDKTKYTATLTLVDTDMYDQGQVQIEISNYQDWAGNLGPLVNNNSENVTANLTIDTIRPELSLVSIVSSNANVLFAKNGDEIILTFIVSEEMTGNPLVTINGVEYEATTTANALTFEVRITVDETFTQGIVQFTIDFSDLAGNTGIQVVSTTDDSSVTIDTVIPELLNIEDNGFYNIDLILEIIESNLLSIVLNGEEVSNGIELTEEISYNLVITDEAGNVLELTFKIDKTALEFQNISNNEHYNHDIEITFDAMDLDRLIVNGEEITLTTEPHKLTNDGEYTVVAYDLAGNVTSITVVIDKIAPNLVGDNLTNASIEADSDFSSYAYSISPDGPWSNWTSTGRTSNVFDLGANLEDGVYYVKIKDRAGNISPTYVKVTLDRLAPIISINPDLPTTYEIKSDDADWTKYFIINDNIDGEIEVTESMITSEVIMTKEGNYKVVLTVKDEAGNETAKELIIKVHDSSFKFPEPIAYSLIIIIILAILYVIYLFIRSVFHIKAYTK